MYLSRLELAAGADENPSLWNSLATPYGAHRELWRLYSRGPEQRRDFLFRYESGTGRGSSRPTFFVLSAQPPSRGDGTWEISTTPFAPKLKRGDVLAFRLRASPTLKVTERGAKQGKRHDVVMHRKQAARRTGEALDEGRLVQESVREWFEAKGQPRGGAPLFRLLWTEGEGMGADGLMETRRLPRLQVSGYRQHRMKVEDRSIQFSSVELDGVVEVMEPEAFLARVGAGFGPQKAFGCGLMLLRRA